MSWLYSIIFAGLMFGSGDGVAVKTVEPEVTPMSLAVAARAQDVTEKFDQTYPLTPDGRVSLTNINGSVTVEAWDRNEVRVEATKIADSQETLNEVTIEVDAQAAFVRIKADYEGWKNRSGRDGNRDKKIEVQFKLWVPKTASLNGIETVNGSVTLSNFVNSTKVSAVNGNVNAINLRGNAQLSTVNGEVRAEFDRVEIGSRISLTTVNGSVRLALPSDVHATIKADSLNGEISNEFGLPIKKGQYVGRNLHGRIGNGEVQIRLNSVNGPLSITRRRDGRQLNPSTNLLQTGSGRNDLDIDVDIDLDIDAAKVAMAATKLSQKEVAEAMKAADVEMRRIKPELERAVATIKAEEMQARITEGQAKITESLVRQTEALNRLGDLGWSDRTATMRKSSNSFKVEGKPKVTVDAPGCNVTVRSWDRPEVRYVLTELGGGKSAVGITEDVSSNGIALKAKSDPNSPFAGVLANTRNVRLEVMVPSSADLRISTDGAIRVAGVSGSIEVIGEDEPIDLRDASGILKLQATDAQIRVIGFAGELDSTIEDGDIFLEGTFTKVTSRAEDGSVTMTLAPNSNATFLSNTEISADGVNAVRDGKGGIRIGTGGPSHSFNFEGGRLILRNTTALESF
jgi:hypothetical protein